MTKLLYMYIVRLISVWANIQCIAIAFDSHLRTTILRLSTIRPANMSFRIVTQLQSPDCQNLKTSTPKSSSEAQLQTQTFIELLISMWP